MLSVLCGSCGAQVVACMQLWRKGLKVSGSVLCVMHPSAACCLVSCEQRVFCGHAGLGRAQLCACPKGLSRTGLRCYVTCLAFGCWVDALSLTLWFGQYPSVKRQSWWLYRLCRWSCTIDVGRPVHATLLACGCPSAAHVLPVSRTVALVCVCLVTTTPRCLMLQLLVWSTTSCDAGV